jgi:hypothetical protein
MVTILADKNILRGGKLLSQAAYHFYSGPTTTNQQTKWSTLWRRSYLYFKKVEVQPKPFSITLILDFTPSFKWAAERKYAKEEPVGRLVL